MLLCLMLASAGILSPRTGLVGCRLAVSWQTLCEAEVSRQTTPQEVLVAEA